MATEKKKKKKDKSKGSEARRAREAEDEAEDQDQDEQEVSNLPAVADELAANLPAHIAQDDADEMAGLENMEGRDLIIPRLVIMQSGSPAVKDRDDDAQEGEIYDSVSKELILGVDEQTHFVPCFMYKEFIAWNDRGSKEMWAGRSLDPRSELALTAQRGDKRQDDRGNEVNVVTEHINFIVLISEFGLDKPFTISCAKSNWKHGKQLMNLSRYRRQPLFAGSYTLATQRETNTKNDEYSAYEFANSGWANPEEYEAAKACYEVMRTSFDAGRLKADHEGMHADADVESAGDAETEM